MGIAIFAKRHSEGRKGCLHRGSSLIRGEQMAEYLGAKLNQAEEGDTLIYVKPNFSEPIPDGAYVDVVDGDGLVKVLKQYPLIHVIASSLVSFEYMRAALENKLVLIPQHHCNYDNVLRDRKGVKTVGFVGTPRTFCLDVDELREKLKEVGLEFSFYTAYRSREEVVEYYKGIDVQVTWRFGLKGPLRHFKNPLRIVNAASFGIPTVGLEELGYEEFSDGYIKVKTVDELVSEICKLRDSEALYKEWSDRIVEMAKPYHISRVAELYKAL